MLLMRFLRQHTFAEVAVKMLRLTETLVSSVCTVVIEYSIKRETESSFSMMLAEILGIVGVYINILYTNKTKIV